MKQPYTKYNSFIQSVMKGLIKNLLCNRLYNVCLWVKIKNKWETKKKSKYKVPTLMDCGLFNENFHFITKTLFAIFWKYFHLWWQWRWFLKRSWCTCFIKASQLIKRNIIYNIIGYLIRISVSFIYARKLIVDYATAVHKLLHGRTVCNERAGVVQILSVIICDSTMQ